MRNISELDVVLAAARDQEILNWLVDTEQKPPVSDEDWVLCRVRYYDLPVEARDEYRVRPNKQMVDGAGMWLATQQGRKWKDLWDTFAGYRMAIRDTLLKYEEDYDIVDDLEQDVAMRVLEKADQYEGRNAAEISTWMVAVAHSIGKNHVEAQLAQKRAMELLAEGIEPAYDDDNCVVPYYERTDLSEELKVQSEALDPALLVEAEDTAEQCMAVLPPQVQSMLHMRTEGHSNTEVAQVQGVSEKTVRNKLSMARQKVRDKLEVILSNKASEREREPLLGGRRLSVELVERACKERVARKSEQLRRKFIRNANPDATLDEWKEMYDENN